MQGPAEFWGRRRRGEFLRMVCLGPPRERSTRPSLILTLWCSRECLALARSARGALCTGTGQRSRRSGEEGPEEAPGITALGISHRMAGPCFLGVKYSTALKSAQAKGGRGTDRHRRSLRGRAARGASRECATQQRQGPSCRGQLLSRSGPAKTHSLGPQTEPWKLHYRSMTWHEHLFVHSWHT